MIIATVLILMLRTIVLFDEVQEGKLREVDEALYDYCVNRQIIVCPKCFSSFEATMLEEQFNIEWGCGCCDTHFKEYPSYTKELI